MIHYENKILIYIVAGSSWGLNQAFKNLKSESVSDSYHFDICSFLFNQYELWVHYSHQFCILPPIGDPKKTKKKKNSTSTVLKWYVHLLVVLPTWLNFTNFGQMGWCKWLKSWSSREAGAKCTIRMRWQHCRPFLVGAGTHKF